MPDLIFDSVLIANRGEIAVRVIRTAKRMGLRTIAVYSDADANARHVHEADVAVRIGPAPAAQSYLSIDKLLWAARRTGAQAVHPGYGFLAENAEFARTCAAAGLVFVGPPPGAIETMGDKIRGKQTVVSAGVSVTPGLAEPGLDDARLIAAADEIGYPVLIKPSAGGGGKGMHRVNDPAEMADALAAARREASSAFCDDTLFIERFVTNPRHIEIQVLADTHGLVVHLGERECSLQRRHQKIVEESPSTLLTAGTRDAMGSAAVEAARSVGYTGAGTVEFIVSADAPDEFFFMEMNTRLQVEHPVTELVTGVDLVEQQLLVAAGLPLELPSIEQTGHAVEARVYAEDPARGFLPTGGRVLALREPAREHVRVDSGLRIGDEVGTAYDPMLAKVIAWGRDRPDAFRRLDRALADFQVTGIGTNIEFLRVLLADPDVRAGDLDTGLVDRKVDDLTVSAVLDPHPAVVAAAVLAATAQPEPRDTFQALGHWRVQGNHWQTWRLELDGRPVEVKVRQQPGIGEYLVAAGTAEPCSARVAPSGPDELLLTVDDVSCRLGYVADGPVTWFTLDGRSWQVRELTDAAGAGGADTDEASGILRAPMPGTVISVVARPGDAVGTDDVVLIVEAMKMEHSLRAPFDGTVSSLLVAEGQAVAIDEHLATVSASDTPE